MEEATESRGSQTKAHFLVEGTDVLLRVLVPGQMSPSHPQTGHSAPGADGRRSTCWPSWQGQGSEAWGTQQAPLTGTSGVCTAWQRGQLLPWPPPTTHQEHSPNVTTKNTSRHCQTSPSREPLI